MSAKNVVIVWMEKTRSMQTLTDFALKSPEHHKQLLLMEDEPVCIGNPMCRLQSKIFFFSNHTCGKLSSIKVFENEIDEIIETSKIPENELVSLVRQWIVETNKVFLTETMKRMMIMPKPTTPIVGERKSPCLCCHKTANL